MTLLDKMLKRSFDFICAFMGLCVLWPVILVTWIVARFDTGASGFFRQKRVGKNGALFYVLKLRTMRVSEGTTITTKNDVRITKCGKLFRNWKLDELPQLWNVLIGQMSLVGPRPDVPGYLDELTGVQKVLLDLRPGITGPASIKYRDEETILAEVDDPQMYNDTVIWPDKVSINIDYYENWSLKKDIIYILRTF